MQQIWRKKDAVVIDGPERPALDISSYSSIWTIIRGTISSLSMPCEVIHVVLIF